MCGCSLTSDHPSLVNVFLKDDIICNNFTDTLTNLPFLLVENMLSENLHFYCAIILKNSINSNVTIFKYTCLDYIIIYFGHASYIFDLINSIHRSIKYHKPSWRPFMWYIKELLEVNVLGRGCVNVSYKYYLYVSRVVGTFSSCLNTFQSCLSFMQNEITTFETV